MADIEDGIKNPDLNPMFSLHNSYPRFIPYPRWMDTREALVRAFSWAIPNDDAIEAIADLKKPVVEIGAGTGYWARLLSKAGVDIVAYDNHPPHMRKNYYFRDGANFFPVRRRGHSIIRKHQDRALFLCWPPYNTSFATDVLKMYKGDTVIYIGEGKGGCTGDDAFHEELDKWKVIDSVRLPRFMGIHDHLTIYTKGIT